jgi:hypothetical protein
MTAYKKGTARMALIYSMRTGRVKEVGNNRINNRRFIMGYNI